VRAFTIIRVINMERFYWFNTVYNRLSLQHAVSLPEPELVMKGTNELMDKGQQISAPTMLDKR
jgi:hypothetical protein